MRCARFCTAAPHVSTADEFDRVDAMTMAQAFFFGGIVTVVAVASATRAAAAAAATTTRSTAAAAKLFPRDQVRLLDGPFKEAQEVDRKHLLAHDVDRLLAPFHAEAGLKERKPRYGSW